MSERTTPRTEWTADAERIVDMLHRTAASLASSLHDFWPSDEGGRNDPCERNVSLHLAHHLLTDGYATFAEAWHPFLSSDVQEKRRGRIDVLALAPQRDWFLAWEAKRILCNKLAPCLEEMLADAERLERFWLNTLQKPERFGERRADVIARCQRGIAALGGLLWIPAKSSHWLLKSWAAGEVTGNKEWDEFVTKVSGLHGKFVTPMPLQSTSKSGNYVLLASVFEIASVKNATAAPRVE